MAKVAQHNKAQMGRGGHAVIEQRMVVDDSMLPAAEELSRLQEVRPDLIDWVMERTAQEQNARHEFNRERVRLAHRELTGTLWVNILCLVFAFLIVAGGMTGSIWMLANGMTVAGSIFAGGTIIGAAALFTRIPKTKK